MNATLDTSRGVIFIEGGAAESAQRIAVVVMHRLLQYEQHDIQATSDPCLLPSMLHKVQREGA